MPQPNQIERKREDVSVKASDLLDFQPRAPITEPGLRTNISVSLQYMGSWLSGNGCVPINHLMEDAATAEICRTQLWQWLKFEAPLDDGRRFTLDLFEQWFDEEVGLLAEVPNIAEAARLMHNMIVADDLVEFLTLPAYELLD
jgi:malate synthase